MENSNLRPRTVRQYNEGMGIHQYFVCKGYQRYLPITDIPFADADEVRLAMAVWDNFQTDIPYEERDVIEFIALVRGIVRLCGKIDWFSSLGN